MANFNRDKGQEEQVGSIQSYLFGGLNTTASNLNCPYEDSPLLLNADVGIEGSVYKRKGSRVIYEDTTPSTGVSLIPFTSALNYNLSLIKRGTSLEVYELVNDIATKVITKANVFSSVASDIQPASVRTSEVEPRLLLFTGYNKPVQVSFIEQQSFGTGGTSVTFNNASRYKNASASNCLVFVDRTRVPGVLFSYNAGTEVLTLTMPAAVGVGITVDLMLITWQWWAEAMMWNGDRYYKTVTRNNAIPIDQVVAVPKEVRSDIDPLEGSSTAYQIFPYRKSQLVAGSVYVFSGRQPQTFEQYGWSDGARYIYDPDNYLTPTPFFITFGALDGASPTTVYFLRRRELRLNNNTPIASANVQVFVNGVLRTQRTTNVGSSYMDYWLHERTPDGTGGWTSTPVTNTVTQLAYYASFEPTSLGVPGSAVVEVVNTTVNHIGSAATGTRYDYNDGTYYPVYGIGLYADYKQGFYPAACAITQGRLVLGGYPHQPLLLTFSATYDSYDPGRPYTYFQVTDDLSNLDTDPFDINISSRPDDRIIAVVEWQSSLFCLTRRAAFRLHGGNQPLSIRNRFVNFISNQGCINSRCITRTEEAILYMADTGVYDLVPQIENAEYQSREKSIKIRGEFGLTSDPTYENIPWMDYDSLNKLVYVAYPMKGLTGYSRRLYVYNTLRESWTEYDTAGGFNTYTGAECVDRALGSRFVLACTNYRIVNTPNDFVLLKMQDERYIDYRRVYTGNGASFNYPLPPNPSFTYTTSAYQRMYSLDRKETASGSFPVLPVAEVNDLFVNYNGRVLVKDVDYVKTPSGDLLLLFTPEAGKSLVVTPRRPVTDSEAGQVLYGVSSPQFIQYPIVYVDNVRKDDYTIVLVVQYTAQFTAPLGSIVETGQAYLSIYTTPLMMPNIMQLERMLHLYAYFDNRQGDEVYRGTDVNGTSAQDARQIVDVPKRRLNGNITIIYSSEYSGETSADVYGFSDIVWDDAFFDIDSPTKQFQQFQLFKEPIKGTGYSIQMMVWNYDEATFRLAGYQIDANIKGKRYKSRY